MSTLERNAVIAAVAVTLASAALWFATGRHYYTKFEVVESIERPVDASDPLAQAGFYDDGVRRETVRRPEFHFGLLPTPNGLLDKHLLSVLSLTGSVWLLAAGLLFAGSRRRRKRRPGAGHRAAARPVAEGVQAMKGSKTLLTVLGLASLAGGLLAAGVTPTAAAPRKGDSAHMRGMNPCGGKVHATRFVINDPMGRNTATFKSEAPLEDIVGTTNKIEGWIEFDPKNPDAGARGSITIPVASLKTGIPLRDHHLQSADWLDAARYPEITLSIDGVRNVKIVKRSRDYTTYQMDVKGTISVHGKRKRITFPARVTYLPESETTRQKMPGDLLAGRGGFTVRLADFGIRGPAGADIIGTKVGQEIGIEVSLIATNRPGGGMNPCGGKSAMNPCGGKSGMNPCGGKSAMNPCGGKSGMNPCGGK